MDLYIHHIEINIDFNLELQNQTVVSNVPLPQYSNLNFYKVRNSGTIILLQRHLLLCQRGGSHLWCNPVSEYNYGTLQVGKWRNSCSITETFQTQVETKITTNKIGSIDSAILSQSSQMSLRPSRRFTSFRMIILGTAWE